MCKKFKFDHSNKWYMHNLASVLENVTHKLQWNFAIQTDHLISLTTRSRNNQRKKRMCQIMYFSTPVDHRVKLKESKKGIKKTVKHKSDGDTNCNRYTRYIHQRISTGTGRLGNKRTIVDYFQTTAFLRPARILRRVLET